jgi:hypothetical protein
MIVVQTIGFAQRRFPMAKPHLALASPTTKNWTVGPFRRPNAELLTATEVESFIDAHHALYFVSAVSPLVSRAVSS